MEPLSLAFVLAFVCYWTGASVRDRIVKAVQGFVGGIGLYVAMVVTAGHLAGLA